MIILKHKLQQYDDWKLTFLSFDEVEVEVEQLHDLDHIIEVEVELDDLLKSNDYQSLKNQYLFPFDEVERETLQIELDEIDRLQNFE